MTTVVSGWLQVLLTIPSHSVLVALPIDSFPKSFGEDLDRWKRYLTSPSPHGPLKPLHDATVRNMVGRTLRFASILVREGVSQRKIASLRDLTRLDHFRRGMDFYWRATDCKLLALVAHLRLLGLSSGY
jgi:hypothetical protein